MVKLKNNPKPISRETNEKIVKTFKSICKIIIKGEGNTIFLIGTGFFMKVSDNLKYLITCYHIINQEMNNKNIELEKLIEKYNNNLKIISDLFYFFQQNVNLFNNSGVINCDGDDIKYDENDPNKNIQCSNFIFTTINNFICKILKDNKEMYDLLLNYKNVIAKNEEENEQIINENNCLKEQLNNFANQLKNQTLNRETIDVTNNEYNRSIDYDGPIKDLKSRINKLEKTIKNQEYD